MQDIDNLKDIIYDVGAVQYNTQFKLSSGETSNHYFDLRLLAADPRGISILSKMLYDIIIQVPNVKSVGGLESGSISMSTSVSMYSWYKHKQDKSNPLITSFFVRKQQKSHGTLKRIEGIIQSPCVILDDVITSGKSALTSVDVIESKGYECKSIICVLFNGSNQQYNNIKEIIDLKYLLHKDELLK